LTFNLPEKKERLAREKKRHSIPAKMEMRSKAKRRAVAKPNALRATRTIMSSREMVKKKRPP